MAARKRYVARVPDTSSFFNKDLFIFILIMAIVAFVTYVLTYNAITAKLNQQIRTGDSANYQIPPSTE